jgi:hypothetical protein
MPLEALRSWVYDHESLINEKLSAFGLARNVSPYSHTEYP